MAPAIFGCQSVRMDSPVVLPSELEATYARADWDLQS